MVIPLLLASSLVVATVTDLRHHRIPNAVTFPLMGAAVALNAVTAVVPGDSGLRSFIGAVGLWESVAGLMECGAVMVALYAVAEQGAGDAKLAAGIGACVGPERGFVCLATTYLVAGAAAMLLLAIGWLRKRVAADAERSTAPAVGDLKLPLAPFLAIGALVAMVGPPPPFTFW